jgi:hypothetical protein
MRFCITHRTRYAYSSPVHESFNEVRLRPASDQTQTCLNFTLTIDPPASVIAFLDYYGNTVHDFSVPYQHSHLNIEAVSDVITFDVPSPVNGTDGDCSPMLAGLTNEEVFANDHAEFLIPSTYVALEDETRALGATLAGRPTRDFGLWVPAGGRDLHRREPHLPDRHHNRALHRGGGPGRWFWGLPGLFARAHHPVPSRRAPGPLRERLPGGCIGR